MISYNEKISDLRSKFNFLSEILKSSSNLQKIIPLLHTYQDPQIKILTEFSKFSEIFYNDNCIYKPVSEILNFAFKNEIELIKKNKENFLKDLKLDKKLEKELKTLKKEKSDIKKVLDKEIHYLKKVKSLKIKKKSLKKISLKFTEKLLRNKEKKDNAKKQSDLVYKRFENLYTTKLNKRFELFNPIFKKFVKNKINYFSKLFSLYKKIDNDLDIFEKKNLLENQSKTFISRITEIKTNFEKYKNSSENKTTISAKKRNFSSLRHGVKIDNFYDKKIEVKEKLKNTLFFSSGENCVNCPDRIRSVFKKVNSNESDHFINNDLVKNKNEKKNNKFDDFNKNLEKNKKFLEFEEKNNDFFKTGNTNNNIYKENKRMSESKNYMKNKKKMSENNILFTSRKNSNPQYKYHFKQNINLPKKKYLLFEEKQHIDQNPYYSKEKPNDKNQNSYLKKKSNKNQNSYLEKKTKKIQFSKIEKKIFQEKNNQNSNLKKKDKTNKNKKEKTRIKQNQIKNQEKIYIKEKTDKNIYKNKKTDKNIYNKENESSLYEHFIPTDNHYSGSINSLNLKKIISKQKIISDKDFFGENCYKKNLKSIFLNSKVHSDSLRNSAKRKLESRGFKKKEGDAFVRENKSGGQKKKDKGFWDFF